LEVRNGHSENRPIFFLFVKKIIIIIIIILIILKPVLNKIWFQSSMMTMMIKQ